MQLLELITRAAEAAGSEYKLAKALEIPQAHVSNWKTGYRTCTVEDRIQLAELAGVDIEEVIADALLERWAGKPKGERLREAFERRGWLRAVAKSLFSHKARSTRLARKLRAKMKRR